MKFPLHLILAASSVPSSSLAYVPSLPLSKNNPLSHRTYSTQLFYQPGNKSSNNSSNNSDKNTESDASNVWTVLANTERWISDTLDKSNRAANERNAQLRKKEEEIERKSKLHFAEEKQTPSSSAAAAAADNNKDGDEKNTNLKPKDNPYARKEVSYVCETGDELSGVVGGIFRRIREGRELGESHGRSAELRLGELLIYHMILCCVSFLIIQHIIY
jgi:hypothetical protein